MTRFIEIEWTSGSLDEARKVARYLVQERFVACAEIVPWIEAIYKWNNKLETAQESKIVMKTKAENYEKVKDVIERNSSYEVPEIIWRSIEGGNQEYLDWMNESVGSESRLNR